MWDLRGEVMNGAGSPTGQQQDRCARVSLVLLFLWEPLLFYCCENQRSGLFKQLHFCEGDVTGQSASQFMVIKWEFNDETEQAVTSRSQMSMPMWKCLQIRFCKRLQENFHCTDVSGKNPNCSLKIRLFIFFPQHVAVQLLYSLKAVLRNYFGIRDIKLNRRRMQGWNPGGVAVERSVSFLLLFFLSLGITRSDIFNRKEI